MSVMPVRSTACRTIYMGMRAIELYETDLAALGLKQEGRPTRDLTLKAINQLKRIRANKRKAAEQTQAFRSIMYGGGESSERSEDIEHERKELELERERAEFELEQQKQEIEWAIKTAKLSDEAKEKVSALARRTLGRR